MSDFVNINDLKVDPDLFRFVNEEVISGLDFKSEDFWSGLSDIVSDLAPKNRALLEKREELQNQIDRWHNDHQGSLVDSDDYVNYLKSIGYIVKNVDDFEISTSNIDPEFSTIAGPQLVVPIMNARFAINAANSRWGSLYDALYGSDVIADNEGAARGVSYNKLRGEKVIAWAKNFLDKAVPLQNMSHFDAMRYYIDNKQLIVMGNDGKTAPVDGNKFRGYRGDPASPDILLLQNHGLHIEIKFDHNSPIGKSDSSGIADIILESAITTIMDCEDSVAAVDGEDKVVAYSNWLGLMRGDLTEKFQKSGNTIVRKMNADREYLDGAGKTFHLPGRSTMLIRNVGHLMTNPAILDRDDNEIPEGIMDCAVTALIALYDIGKNGRRINSPAGSMYIVKPKMHGPEEVAFADELFGRVESMLGLNQYTLKMGIMDEERRTTVNLKACIGAARNRVMFINTGFLDRTGDEIHTSMEAGAMIRKGDMKQSVWINAYEDWNVDIGLACGFSGKAQIGKGMWAMPDLMADMVEQKITHPKSGANTAWVPSPTAATLHATHYHLVDVKAVQEKLSVRKPRQLDEILSIPVTTRPNWSARDIQQELDNCAQGILGYVVRWIDQGIGCSKVPDIHDVGLMEDRATLRISSQMLANWLHHKICTKDQVLETMERMAVKVDGQNAGDPNYREMASNFENSIAFQAACELVFEGRTQPSGYTEPILHRRRRELKASLIGH